MADDGTSDKNAPEEQNTQKKESKRQIVTVDGDKFFQFLMLKIPMEDHVRSIRNMPMREDDIIIAAFPKCGTHWIWEVVQMLIAGKAEHNPSVKEQVMLEFNEVATFEPIPSPRILNSHFFLRQLSNEIVTKKSRVIHVIRNPKDVAVSAYFHRIQVKGIEDMGFHNYGQEFLQGGQLPGGYGDYFAFMQEMTKWQKDNPDAAIITIYFEDVKKDPVQCVRQLAQFLQVETSDAMCADIADQCSFKKLKQADETMKEATFSEIYKDNAPKLYRKGEVGDWKNYFTVALSEQYDQLVPEKLKGCDLKLQYTI